VIEVRKTGLLFASHDRDQRKRDAVRVLIDQPITHEGEALMKRSATLEQNASAMKTADFAVDASGRLLNLYTELGGECIEAEFRNTSAEVEDVLRELEQQALAAGYADVRVICEPSGGCEQILMKTAKRLGMKTAWANGEAVAKLRVVESNDTGKTDLKDPRVIHMLAGLGKMLKHRELDAPYSLMREWHAIYLDAEGGAVAAKCAIHAQIRLFFPDFSFKTDFLFGPSGRGLHKRYGLNPYRIVGAGRRRFEATMKKSVPGMQKRSFERLWVEATSSSRHAVDKRLVEVQERRLGQLFEDLDRHLARKEEAARNLENLYLEAQALDANLPSPDFHGKPFT
jgi:hypothetical protein